MYSKGTYGFALYAFYRIINCIIAYTRNRVLSLRWRMQFCPCARMSSWIFSMRHLCIEHYLLSRYFHYCIAGFPSGAYCTSIPGCDRCVRSSVTNETANMRIDILVIIGKLSSCLAIDFQIRISLSLILNLQRLSAKCTYCEIKITHLFYILDV